MPKQVTIKIRLQRKEQRHLSERYGKQKSWEGFSAQIHFGFNSSPRSLRGPQVRFAGHSFQTVAIGSESSSLQARQKRPNQTIQKGVGSFFEGT
jgi:hypothetical protein